MIEDESSQWSRVFGYFIEGLENRIGVTWNYVCLQLTIVSRIHYTRLHYRRFRREEVWSWNVVATAMDSAHLSVMFAFA